MPYRSNTLSVNRRIMGFESGVLLIDTHLGLRGIIDYSTVNRRIIGFELGVLLIDVSWKIIAGELEYVLCHWRVSA